MTAMKREGYAPEWIEYETSLTGDMLPDAHDPSYGEAFNVLMRKMAGTFPPPPQGVTSRDEDISAHITVRVYQPPGAKSDSRLRSVVVWYHGGGWVTGNLDSEDHFCRTMCGQADVIVVSVLYRKFPAIRFPDNLQDCYDGFLWAYEHASDLQADPRQFLAMGGSAGGALAIATVHKLILAGHRERVSGLLTLASAHIHRSAVPSQYQHLHTSMEENSGPIPFVTDEMALRVYDLLGANPPYDDESKHWFPVSMGVEGVEDFPPTWIIDCEKYCLRDDGRVLLAEMDEAGLNVKREVVPGMPHYYWSFPVQKAAADFRERLFGGLRWVLDCKGEGT